MLELLQGFERYGKRNVFCCASLVLLYAILNVVKAYDYDSFGELLRKKKLGMEKLEKKNKTKARNLQTIFGEGNT